MKNNTGLNEKEIKALLSRLKDGQAEYPAELLSKRRDMFLGAVPAAGILIASKVILRKILGGIHAGSVAATNAIILSVVSLVSIGTLVVAANSLGWFRTAKHDINPKITVVAPSGLVEFNAPSHPDEQSTPTNLAKTALPTQTTVFTPISTFTSTALPDITPSLAPDILATSTSTSTQDPASSPTPTFTSTATSTPSKTSTPTYTPSRTPTFTSTGTITPAPTDTITRTPTRTLTPAPTETFTPTPTRTNTPSPTLTPTRTNTPLPTDTFTPSPTDLPRPTPTITPIPTDTLTPLPSDTPLPTSTLTPVPPPTFTPTKLPTKTPRPTCTPLPTKTKKVTPTPLPTRTKASLTLVPIVQGERIDQTPTPPAKPAPTDTGLTVLYCSDFPEVVACWDGIPLFPVLLKSR